MTHDSGTQAGPITGINVTPLVDVTLVLLIVFMVTAKLIVQQQALEVDLPHAATGTDVQEVFSLVLFQDGRLELNGAPLRDDEEVLARADEARADHGDLRAIIQADAGVTHGRVTHVLDLLRRAGISKIGFGVVPLPVAVPDLPIVR
jgi:biopolymer transport protein ExbD